MRNHISPRKVAHEYRLGPHIYKPYVIGRSNVYCFSLSSVLDTINKQLWKTVTFSGEHTMKANSTALMETTDPVLTLRLCPLTAKSEYNS